MRVVRSTVNPPPPITQLSGVVKGDRIERMVLQGVIFYGRGGSDGVGEAVMVLGGGGFVMVLGRQ